MADLRKKLAAILSTPSARELTDVLVIFSITFLTYKAMHDSNLFNKESYFRVTRRIRKLIQRLRARRETAAS